MTSTKIDNMIIVPPELRTLERSSCEPSDTKKSTIKKSLSGFVLLAISNLYGNEERLNPAINAQISREKPIASINAADNRHRPIANTRRNSCDCATNDTRRGNTYLINI